ncbi:hypothetical protein BB561_001536 [Smittium simulii]|uniref:Uncharacterized protein n=1 Tax=Smittium simulii TaxID=133385 RepID=A0A2T9YU61_9FUNG|nr:hypothetical protein BB561_001536 [Smittium simulii]
MSLYNKTYSEKLTLPAASSDYLQHVKNSCDNFLGTISNLNALELKLSEKAKLYKEGSITPPDLTRQKMWRKQLPLKFPNTATEINFIALVELIYGCVPNKEILIYKSDSGSSEVPERYNIFKMEDKDFFHVVLSGCLSMYLSQIDFSADSLENISVADIFNYFQIPVLEREKPVYNDTGIMPGVTLSEPSQYQKIAKTIQYSISLSAKSLKVSGYPDFASLIIKSLSNSKISILSEKKIDSESKTAVCASSLISALVNVIPVFREGFECQTDSGIIHVYLFSSAQRLCYSLYKRFSESDPNTFKFHDVDKLHFLLSEYNMSFVQKAGMDLALSNSTISLNEKTLPITDYHRLMAIIVGVSSEYIRITKDLNADEPQKSNDSAAISINTVESLLFGCEQ